MAVDYLSALNSNGSGLNTTQLVETIVTAEIEPRRNLVTQNQAETEASISEMAKLRSAFNTMKTSLRTEGVGQATSVTTSSSSVGLVVNDITQLHDTVSEIEVSQIAKRQVLEFSGFTSADAALSEGSLSVATGSWSGSVFSAKSGADIQTIALDSTSASLSGLASKLNALDGVSASVIAKGDGTYSLSVLSETGAENALQIIDTDGTLSAFDTTDNSAQIVAAADANFTFNGLSLSRATNQISDLIDGLTIELNSVTDSAATVAVLDDPEIAYGEISAYLQGVNELISAVNSATARGINGSDAGPLAGDPAMSAIGRKLASLTTTPLEGYGDTPIYLSDFGVRTERDGSLSVDKELFDRAFAANPSGFRAIFHNMAISSDDQLEVSLSATANPPSSSYDFVYNDDGTASLNGETLLQSSSGDQVSFYAVSGDFKGVSINASNVSAPSTATIYFGQSSLDRVADYIESALANSGQFKLTDDRLAESANSQLDELSALEEKEQLLASLYRTKFTAMEQRVTQLKSTGSYLTNMMDSWKAQNSQ